MYLFYEQISNYCLHRNTTQSNITLHFNYLSNVGSCGTDRMPYRQTKPLTDGMADNEIPPDHWLRGYLRIFELWSQSIKNMYHYQTTVDTTGKPHL
jgi:hypothetical protein